MAHLIFIVDGMQEGIDIMEKQLDRHSFGHSPCRLRKLVPYDLQFDDRDREKVLNEFHQVLKEHTYKDGLSYKMKYKVSPFKHGKFRMAIAALITILGAPFGVKPAKTWEIKEPKPQEITKPLMNIYPIAIIEDNACYNKQQDRWEEWL